MIASTGALDDDLSDFGHSFSVDGTSQALGDH